MVTPFMLWLLSGTGALAFLVVGVLLGRLRKTPPPDTTELDEERAARAAAQAELAKERKLAASARAAEQSAQQELEQERNRAETATDRARELGEKLVAHRAEESRAGELEEEVQRLKGLLENQPEAADTHDSNAADLSKQPGKANQDLLKARQELANERSLRTRRDAEIRELKEQAESLEKELQKSKQEDETEVFEGSGAGEALRELARLQKVLKETQDELAQVREAKPASVAVSKPLPNEAEKERVKNKQLALDLERERTMRKKLAAEVEQERAAHKRESNELAQLKQRLDEVTSEKEDLAVRQEASANYVRRAQEQARKSKDEVARLQEELEAAKRNDSDAADPSEQLKQALARGRESAAQLVRLKQELAQAKHDAKASNGTEETVARLEKELAQLRSAAANQTEELRKRATAAEQELDTTRARLQQVEAAAKDPQRAATTKLKAPAVDDAATRDLKLRLGQAETRAARAVSLEAENERLKNEIEELRPQAALVSELQERTGRLEARLFALGDKPSVPPPPIDAAQFPSPAATQTTLRSLLDSKHTRAVVVADAHGLPVGAEGDVDSHEGLAAVTGLAGTLADQARQLLPLSEITSVQFEDTNAIIVCCRLFDCQGDAMALATLGTQAPSATTLARVVEGVIESMGGATARGVAPQG